MSKKNIHIRQKDPLSELREAAEKLILSNDVSNGQQLPSMDISDLLHNVQVQQIELEMQNDELTIANEQLELEKARFAGLFDLAPVGYFILNHFGIIENVNSTGLQLLGVERRLIIGKRFQSFISGNEWNIFSSFLQSLKIADGKHSCQISLLRSNTMSLHIQLEGTATQKTVTDSHRFYLAVIDVTERQNAAVKLSQSNQRLNLALSASLAGTFEINLKTGRIFLDEFSEQILGFEKEEFTGRKDTFLQIIHPEDRGNVELQLLKALNYGEKLDIDYRIILKNRTVCYVGVRGHMIRTGNDEGDFVGILTNIDQKKRVEHEAQQLKLNQHQRIIAATLQTQENERKRISESLHDSVSQLLYSIKLNLNYQQADQESLAKVNQLLELAIQETRNISFELAPSILTDFGLPVTIEEMCRRLSTSQLAITCSTIGFKERIDETTEINIFRIVQELVNNSIKHASATSIHLRLVKDRNKVNIECKDDGVGFTYEVKGKNTMGTGLSSIKNRLNLFNGTMDIQSNEGTQVLIVFEVQ